MSLSMGQMLAIRRMKASGLQPEDIAVRVRAKLPEILDHLGILKEDGTRRVRKKHKKQVARSCYRHPRMIEDGEPFGRMAAGMKGENNERVPDNVMAERDRRLALNHATLTAAVFGDPLPGRSALDRKHARSA